MKKTKQQLIFSPSDISVFHQSKFASFMDRVWLEDRSLAQTWGAEIEKDEYMSLLGQQGDEHENKVLVDLIKKYGEENVAQLSMKDSIDDTESAMRAGKQIIFQANLSRDNFAGYADFLIRIERPSNLGNYSYEVWDAKLSQVAKTEHVLQVCAYSWMLEPVLGHLESEAGFYLGRGKVKAIRVAEYFAYFMAIVRDFIDYQSQPTVTKDDMPDVNMEKTFGRWESFAKLEIEKSDSLRQVAGIRVSQIGKLNKLGITSLTQLANTLETTCAGIGESTFYKLKTQARLQLESKTLDLPAIKYLEEDTGKGFQKLPLHNNADVFFDIEGHPLVEGGLEYLWGVSLHNDPINKEHAKGKDYQFLDWWAHDAEQEKTLIEAFIDWVYARWQKHPQMHVYHYASYEITALKKLTGVNNTRIEKLDDLLRAEVFVDLYRIVTQAMQLGTKNYSIKSVEALYGRKHTGDVADGAASIVVYEKWREEFAQNHESEIKPIGWEHSQDLTNIRNYNIDDCESTLELVLWLREQQVKSGISFATIKKLTEEKQLTDKQQQHADRTSNIKKRQLALNEQFNNNENLKTDPLAKGLIELLEFHTREDKPKWWEYFNLKDANDDELYADASAIVNANVINKEIIDEKLTITVKFDDQQPYREDKLGNAEILSLNIPCKKVRFCEYRPEIELELSSDVESNSIPEVISLIARPTIIPSMALENRLIMITECYFNGGAVSNLVKQLILAVIPKFHTDNCLPISRDTGDDSSQFINDIIAAVQHLDASVLSIQGPPGSGKTTTADAVISELIKQGLRVGIMSNSHSAIFNLQQKVIISNQHLSHAKVGGLGGTISDFAERYPEFANIDNFSYRPNANFTKKQPYSSFSTVGATVYAFVKDDAVNAPLDYLFVDEASQVALANLIAVTPSTKNIVLMGDQMQLEQPVQGAHPGIAKKSALEHLLQERKVIPDNKGIFLDKTYRMHPSVCKPISDLVYESKLYSDSQTALQSIVFNENHLNLHNNGIQFIAVEHQYNTQASIEEVDKIKEILEQLEGSKFIDNKGVERPFTKKDVLIVAPYNMQVELLKNNIDAEYQIGTIDKFQGKEAQVVVISMASSLAEESARGIDFLFDVNRLNVAVSRAKALALIIASPELTKTRASNPDQAKKVAAFFNLIGGNQMHDEKVSPKLETSTKNNNWENTVSNDELNDIKDILFSHNTLINKVNALLNLIAGSAPKLNLWATKTNGGDIRIGRMPPGQQRATVCYMTIKLAAESCFVNFAHSYFVAVLGGNYTTQEVKDFAERQELTNFNVENGSKPGTINLRVDIQDLDLDLVSKLLAKLGR
jgi:predicted RecB family nuclease